MLPFIISCARVRSRVFEYGTEGGYTYISAKELCFAMFWMVETSTNCARSVVDIDPSSSFLE